MRDRNPLQFHSDALDEIAEHVKRFRSEVSLRVAERYWRQLQAALDIIERDPARFPEDADGIRRVHFRKYPFTIHYEILDGIQPFVWAVAHQRQKPGYWTGRR